MTTPRPGDRLRHFLAWWKAELLTLLPDTLRRDGGDGERWLLLLWLEQERRLYRQGEDGWEPWRRLAAEDEAGLAEALLQQRRAGWRLLLRLPSRAGLTRPLRLPLAAEEELDQVVAFQLDTLSPLPAGRIYHDYRVVRRDREAGSLELELCIAPRDQVDPALKALSAWGVVPDGLDLSDDADPLAPVRFNLLPAEAREARRHSPLRPAIRLLLALDLALAVAVAGAAILDRAAHEERLRVQVETARLQAQAVTRLRQRLERQQEEARFLADQRRRALPALALLDELSRLLPQEAWLESLELRDGVVILHGLAAEAAPLIGILERSPLLDRVAFRAPLVQDRRYDAERFQIEAHVTVPEAPRE